MPSPLSRTMSLATAGYAVFALVRPRHLGAAITDDPAAQARYDLVARTYGVRDLAISAVGVRGSDAQVRAAMVIRIALDVGDGATLALSTGSSDVRKKVLGVTLGWAALNTLAVLADRRRGR